MKELEQKIATDSTIIDNDIIKVDSFINHQIDVALTRKIAKEMAASFPEANKVLTIETSGIAIAYAVAEELGNVPLVFAKKAKSKITGGENYTQTIHSFTKGIDYPVTVSKRYLSPSDRVLIVDDFLAEGNASLGLMGLVEQAGATTIGVAVEIEKAFQSGHKAIEEKGVKVYAAASIKAFEDNKAIF